MISRRTVSLTLERPQGAVDVTCDVVVTRDPGEGRTWERPMGGCPPSVEVEIVRVKPDVELTEGEVKEVEEIALEDES